MNHESTNLLSILSSMNQYILVFTETGQLSYANQSLKKLFSVEKKSA
jgi:hypothetical protein